MLVSKFGGSSLADANQIKKVLAIIKSNSERRIIVVSAPGERHPHDQKITNLFEQWYRLNELQLSSEEVRQIIQVRYLEIIAGLSLSSQFQREMTEELHEIGQAIKDGTSIDYAMSRGEYLNSKIIAEALGYDFVDAAQCIRFNKHGRHVRDDVVIENVLRDRNVVIPGYYGSMPDGSIKTFSRGGSDITGAIVARGINADIYENWTDVSGLRVADPRVVDQPRGIRKLTYLELYELAYMGASVFHPHAAFPVMDAGITTNIRNTNDPKDEGTYVVSDETWQASAGLITGIAGRKDFTAIAISKRMMNQEVGFARKILTVLEKHKVSFEHMPSGIDTLSIIIHDEQLIGKRSKVLNEIQRFCQPDSIQAYPNMAMIAVVGRAMVHVPGTAARAFTALANAGINLRVTNQGSSEISIIIGVENVDYERAVNAIYSEFVG